MPSYGGGRSLPTGGYAPNTRPGQNQRNAGYALQQQMQGQPRRGGVTGLLQRLRGRMGQPGMQQRGQLLQGAGQAMQGGGLGGLQQGLESFRNWRQQSQPQPGPGAAPPPPPPQMASPEPMAQTGGNMWEGGSAGQPPSWGAGTPWMPEQKPAFQPFNPGFPKPPKPAGGGWAGGADPFGAVTNNYGGY